MYRPMTTQMHADRLDHDIRGWTCVHVEGEVDLQSAPVLKDALTSAIAAGIPALLVDLCDVGFMDSSGLGALVTGMKRAQEADTRFGLVCTDGPVRKVLTITRLDRAFEMFPSLDAVPELGS